MTQAFNLSQFANNVDSSGKAILTSGQAVTGTLPVGNGGTGSTGLTQYGVVIGGGSSQLDTVSTTSPTTAAAGDLLVYQGSGLSPIWKTPVVGTTIEYITTTTLWTVPAGITKALVWVFGGGGGGGQFSSTSTPRFAGGVGGYIGAFVTGLSGTVSITVGAGGLGGGGSGGAAAQDGGTSSFGSYITCTGGTRATSSGSGTAGTATLGAGVTRIRAICGVEPTIIFGGSVGHPATTWATTYSDYPGKSYVGSYFTITDGNGMGGAVILQY